MSESTDMLRDALRRVGDLQRDVERLMLRMNTIARAAGDPKGELKVVYEEHVNLGTYGSRRSDTPQIIIGELKDKDGKPFEFVVSAVREATMSLLDAKQEALSVAMAAYQQLLEESQQRCEAALADNVGDES